MDNLQIATTHIEDKLTDSYQYLLAQGSDISAAIEEEIETSSRKLRREMKIHYPYRTNEELLQEMSVSTGSMQTLRQAIAGFKRLCKESKTHYNDYWDKQFTLLENSDVENKHSIAEKQHELETIYELVIEYWRKLQDQLKTEWELVQISSWREAQLKVLFEKLAIIAELFESIKSLGLEPGALFDLSSGALTEIDIEPIKRWLNYLKNDKGVQALIDLMG